MDRMTTCFSVVQLTKFDKVEYAHLYIKSVNLFLTNTTQENVLQHQVHSKGEVCYFFTDAISECFHAWNHLGGGEERNHFLKI